MSHQDAFVNILNACCFSRDPIKSTEILNPLGLKYEAGVQLNLPVLTLTMFPLFYDSTKQLS